MGNKLAKAVEAFKKEYPSATLSDIFSFSVGFEAAQKPKIKNTNYDSVESLQVLSKLWEKKELIEEKLRERAAIYVKNKHSDIDGKFEQVYSVGCFIDVSYRVKLPNEKRSRVWTDRLDYAEFLASSK